ncbi:alpha/beta hydrolase [Vibrio panuliri]|uniref:XynC protein n=1 Tax=Vibrio panuliri TaxID=1381081 RepID=A0ABX3F9Y9_9VIBR|nr:alpha/beta hydrolase family protein [Vibrio panuliri]KAB1453716.1 esterase family protein [Vibrio panuliri]OLQ86246.1 hypothetical protein BIY20_15185 [Vibrio panuliri]
MKKLAVLISTILASSAVNAFQIETVEIDSDNTPENHKATVILPDGYSQDQRYPVVYVLHGWSGDYKVWHEKTKIAKQADIHNLIIVLPEGNYDKWYIDSPVKKRSNYQTYIGQEVVEYIDKHFRTKAEKTQRAITGLSMGGFGAFNIALNNLDTFGNIGSISGGFEPKDFRYTWGLEEVFGDYDKYPTNWDNRAIKNTAHKLIFKDINITIDCGIDDFFIDSNRELHVKLQQLELDHDYSERPGGHTWVYWDNAIQYQMLFFSNKFAQAN